MHHHSTVIVLRQASQLPRTHRTSESPASFVPAIEGTVHTHRHQTTPTMGTPQQRLRALLRHLGAGPQQEPAQSSSSPTRPAPAAASAGAPLGLTRILFQGDSITDAGRSREQTEPNAALGTGCARRNCWPGLLFCLTDPPPPLSPCWRRCPDGLCHPAVRAAGGGPSDLQPRGRRRPHRQREAHPARLVRTGRAQLSAVGRSWPQTELATDSWPQTAAERQR